MMSEEIAWKVVNNTVKHRMVKFSLIHKLIPSRKLKRRTKIMNKKIKRVQIVKTYKQYVNMKTCILRDLTDDSATDESEVFEDADYSNLYNSEESLANYMKNVYRKCTKYSIDIVKKVETKDNTSNLAKKKVNSQNSKRKSSADVGWRDVIKKKPIKSESLALKAAQRRKSTLRSARISSKDVREESNVLNSQLSSESSEENEENNISRNNEACIAKRLLRSSNKINSSNEIMPDIIAGEEIRYDTKKSVKQPAEESPNNVRNETLIGPTTSTKNHSKKSQLDESRSQNIIKDSQLDESRSQNIIKDSQSNESRSQDLFKSQNTPEESQLNESNRDMFKSQNTPENIKRNLMSALDDENTSKNIEKPSISTETHEAHINLSKSPITKRTSSNKNKSKAFSTTQSLFNDNTNQPKDSGIDEDTEEELPKGRKKVCKKKKGEKSNENLQTASSTSECETNPTVEMNSPSIDNNSNQSLSNDALDKVNTENLMSSDRKSDGSGEDNINKSLANNKLDKVNIEDLMSSEHKNDDSGEGNNNESLTNDALDKVNTEILMSSDRKSDGSGEDNINKSLANNKLDKVNIEDLMSSEHKNDDSEKSNSNESLTNDALNKVNTENLMSSDRKSDDSGEDNNNESLTNNKLDKVNIENLKSSEHQSGDSGEDNIDESLANNALDKVNTENLISSDHKSDDSEEDNIDESLANSTLDKVNIENLKSSEHQSGDSGEDNIDESLANDALDKVNTENLMSSDHKSDDSEEDNIDESLANSTLDKVKIEDLMSSEHQSDDSGEDNIDESLANDALDKVNTENLMSSDHKSDDSEEDNIDESLANSTLDKVKIEDLMSSEHQSDDSKKDNINESLANNDTLDKMYTEDSMLPKHRSDDSEDDQQDRSSRQRSQPRVMCTEIIKKKYRIVPCDTSPFNGSTNLETSTRYSSDEEIPESMETSQNMDDSMSPFSKRRLQRMKRLNLTEDSESSLSENDDKHCTAENMRNQLLKRSGESSDVSSNENENTNVKHTISVHSPKKQKTYKKLKIEKYKKERASSSIKMHEEREEISDTENSCEHARKSLSKKSCEKNTSENSFEGIASRLDVQYNSKSVNNRNLDSCESDHLSDTEYHNSDQHEAKNSLKTGTTTDVVTEKSRICRPSNLQGFIEEENLTCDTTMPSLVLKDIKDEDVFILDVPSMVLEHNLVGERIYLSKKKLKLGKQKYKVTSKDVNRVTCVFGTLKSRKPYKTVNITPLASVVANEKIIKPSVETLNRCKSDGRNSTEDTSKTKTDLRYRKKGHHKTYSKYITEKQSQINN